MIARDKDVVTLTTVTPRGAKRSSTVLLAVYTDAQKEKERSSSFIVIHLRNFTLVSITFSSFKITSFAVPNQTNFVVLG